MGFHPIEFFLSKKIYNNSKNKGKKLRRQRRRGLKVFNMKYVSQVFVCGMIIQFDKIHFHFRKED